MNIIVTVVLTTYNRASLLPEAIKSVLNQTFSDCELIVVDDCSSDNTSDVVNSFQDFRIRYIRHDENKGLAASRNTGLKYAKGKYIAYLDDDDEWVPEKLALQLEVMKKSEHHPCLVYAGSQSGWMEDYIFQGFTMSPSCMLVATQELNRIGGHSEELTSCIDHDIWIKMAQAGFYMKPVPKDCALMPNRTVPPNLRMTNRLDERFKGIEEFFDKWKSYVIKNYGTSYWQKIEAVYQWQTFNTIKQNYLKQIINKQQLLHYCQQLIKWQYERITKDKIYLYFNYLGLLFNLIEYTPLQFYKRRIFQDLVTFNLKFQPNK